MRTVGVIIVGMLFGCGGLSPGGDSGEWTVFVCPSGDMSRGCPERGVQAVSNDPNHCELEGASALGDGAPLQLVSEGGVRTQWNCGAELSEGRLCEDPFEPKRWCGPWRWQWADGESPRVFELGGGLRLEVQDLGAEQPVEFVSPRNGIVPNGTEVVVAVLGADRCSEAVAEASSNGTPLARWTARSLPAGRLSFPARVEATSLPLDVRLTLRAKCKPQVVCEGPGSCAASMLHSEPVVSAPLSLRIVQD